MSDASAPTLVIEERPGAPRKRRKGWIVALLVLVVLLIIAFFVGENLARQYATNLVRERIVDGLALDPATDVEVDLGSGFLLLQAATGSVNDVTVDIPELVLGEIRGAASLEARDVPLDSTQPIRELDITATIDEDNVQSLASYLSGVDLSSIELRDGIIRVGTEIDLAVLTFPVAIDLAPGTSEGGISFTPQTILVGEEQLSVAELTAFPPLQAIAGELLASRDFCVASSLPQGLEITSVEVIGTDLVVGLSGDGIALAGDDLTTNGSCPAG